MVQISIMAWYAITQGWETAFTILVYLTDLCPPLALHLFHVQGP